MVGGFVASTINDKEYTTCIRLNVDKPVKKHVLIIDNTIGADKSFQLTGYTTMVHLRSIKTEKDIEKIKGIKLDDIAFTDLSGAIDEKLIKKLCRRQMR